MKTSFPKYENVLILEKQRGEGIGILLLFRCSEALPLCAYP
jgi:hypothetical protein